MFHSFSDVLAIFFIYGFLGWMSEVAFAALQSDKFVNRGFLMGPICPIYGFGVVAVLYFLEPVMDRPLSVFVLSTLITSTIELLIGVFSEKMLHERLWDYSTNFFNIGGYVCLSFSLMWGVGCMLIVYGIHPLIAMLIAKVPFWLETTLLIFFSAVIITDGIITCTQAMKIERHMKAIDELAEKLEAVSDTIGKSVSDNTLLVKEKLEESEALQKQAEAAKKQYESLQKQYNELLSKKNVVHRHLFNSFTHLQQGRYKAAYERIREAGLRTKQ